MYTENKRRYRGRFAAVEAHQNALYSAVPHSVSKRIEQFRHRHGQHIVVTTFMVALAVTHFFCIPTKWF